MDSRSVLQREEPTFKEHPWYGVSLLSLVFCVLLAGLYAQLVWELGQEWWNDANYSHGFLVPVFSGYLIWQQRETLKGLVPAGSWLGLPVLLVGIGIFLLGDIGGEEFLIRSSLIIVMTGLVLFHAGPEIFRRLAFPLAFLFFMIPLPALLFNTIAFPLQGLAAQNAAWTLDLVGVPVLRDGNVIHLSDMSLGVTEACSGIRSLISLLALTGAWAYLTLPGTGARVVLVIATVPITIVANAARVVFTGLVGQWFGMQYAQGFFHAFSGWVIFLVAFIGLLGIHGCIQVAGLRHEKEEG